MARHPPELTTTEGKHLLEDLADAFPGVVAILTGGEPLTRPDVLEFAHELSGNATPLTVTRAAYDEASAASVAPKAPGGATHSSLHATGGRSSRRR